MKHHFDFKVACREFTKEVNKDNKDFFYMVDAKQLQVRWTDIEIRKFRLPEHQLEDDTCNLNETQKKPNDPKGSPSPKRHIDFEDTFQDLLQLEAPSTSQTSTQVHVTNDLEDLD